MVITREWLLNNRTESGSWTRAQLDAIDISWPPREGWMRLVTGTEINESQRQRFERGKHIKTNRTKNRAAKKINLDLF